MKIKIISAILGSILLSGTALISQSAIGAQSSGADINNLAPAPVECGKHGVICRKWKARALHLESLARKLDEQALALDIENTRLQETIASTQSDEIATVQSNQRACLAEFDTASGQYKLDAIAPDNAGIGCFSQDDFDAFLDDRDIVLDLSTDFGYALNTLRDKMVNGVSVAIIGDQAQMLTNHTTFGVFRIEPIFSFSYFTYDNSEQNFYQLYTSFFSSYSNLNQQNSIFDFDIENGDIVKYAGVTQFPEDIDDAAVVIAEMMREFSNLEDISSN